MPATAFSTGPASIFVGTGFDGEVVARVPLPSLQTKGYSPPDQPASATISLNGPRFLGWGERGVRIELRSNAFPYYQDEIGAETEADLIWEAETAIITADLTVYDEYEYRKLGARVNVRQDNRGVYLPTGPGTMLLAEGLGNFPLWISFPYNNSTVFGAAGGMGAGYRFFACVLLNDVLAVGTAARKTRLIIKALPFWDSTTGAVLLYDEETSEVSQLANQVPRFLVQPPLAS